jgi:hypothetical protein
VRPCHITLNQSIMEQCPNREWYLNMNKGFCKTKTNIHKK